MPPRSQCLSAPSAATPNTTTACRWRVLRTNPRSGTRTLVHYGGIAPTPFPGLTLGLIADGFRLTCIDFLWDDDAPASRVCPDSAIAAHSSQFLSAREVIELALHQLEDFFAHRPVTRPVPLVPQGTPFQRRVWQAMGKIPAGQTRRYGELAQELGNSARAVGGACRANPIPLLIPCHRVVAASGQGGFAGAQDGRLVELKRWLLAHEQGI